MAKPLPFRFSIGSTPAEDRHMRLPLPASVDSAGREAAGPSVGDYFDAAREFLLKDRLHSLKHAVKEGFGLRIASAEIDEIRVSIEKHGAFYHPARVEVRLKGSRFPFALNVAVSRAGIETLPREYLLLEGLYRDFPYPFLPRVFSRGEASTARGAVRMFLAEWLEGFHEFHLEAGAEGKIVMWEGESRRATLSPGETGELYRRIARILTCYYDPLTFRQIYPWHHAAGDFVIRRGERGLDVRLITVRQYAPLMEAEEITPETMLHALLLFFLSLSIRTRLDRAGGTGEIVWAPDYALAPTVDGFIEELYSKALGPFSGEDTVDLFCRYAGEFSEEELCDLSFALVNAWNQRAAEIKVVLKNIPSHAALLHRMLSEPRLSGRGAIRPRRLNN